MTNAARGDGRTPEPRVEVDAILRAVLEQYRLEWHGIHGVTHWGRVLDNGLRLAESTGASVRVVTLFALFHDACRTNDGHDPDHGRRGAALAASLRGSVFEIGDREFRRLHQACVEHTDGSTDGDVTVRTCWDADRLDLARVGIDPRPERLCTDAGRDPGIIAWASRRAREELVPDGVRRVHDELARGG